MRNSSSFLRRTATGVETVHRLAISCLCGVGKVFETVGRDRLKNIRQARAEGWTVYVNRGDRCPQCSEAGHA